MLPALPTGRQCTSGARPSASQTSNAADFCPSSRTGLTELTRATGGSGAVLRASSGESSKLPSTWRIRAPCMTAWASLPSAILPRGTRTAQVSPARAAYAAADADVLPVDAQITALAPDARAYVMATVIPRSLNDPVGLAPSTFSSTRDPVSSPRYGASTSGVPPSPRVTTRAPGGTAIRSGYAPTIPGHDRSTDVVTSAPSSVQTPSRRVW